MKKRLVSCGVIFVLVLLLLPAYSLGSEVEENWPEMEFDEEFEWEEAADYRPEADSFHTELVRGVILKVIEEKEEADPFTNETIRNQTLYVRITSGAFKGKEIEAYNHGVSNPAFQINVTEGSRVILALEMENGEIVQTYIADYLREPQVYTLAAFFVILLLAIGWRKGAKALCSLLITLVLVWWVLIPGLLKGYNPVIYTVAVATVATAITMFTVAGFGWKSIAASLGTIAGVGVAGALALLMGKAAHLTGFGNEEAVMLLYLPNDVQLDIQGLLFAGIIIGALGAVMDVGMSIASAVEEVKTVNPELGVESLIKSGLNVGRDIIGTMSNTLILAYTGSSVSLLLILMAYEESFLKMINLDMIASEIVRALSGSIGMVLAVPITAVIAGFLYGYGAKKPKEAA
jgi:uncharacterized membrane protein